MFRFLRKPSRGRDSIMKRLRIIGASAVVLAFGLLAAQPAQAGPGVSAFCKSFNDFGLGHGGCVSLFTNDNPVAAIATLCRNPATQAAFGVTNHGQCVKAFKALF